MSDVHTPSSATGVDAAAGPTSAPKEEYDPLRSDIAFHPLSDATITVRVIKSFEYRTFKGLVLHGVDLGKMTVGELMENTKRGECFSWIHALRDLILYQNGS